MPFYVRLAFSTPVASPLFVLCGGVDPERYQCRSTWPSSLVSSLVSHSACQLIPTISIMFLSPHCRTSSPRVHTMNYVLTLHTMYWQKNYLTNYRMNRNSKLQHINRDFIDTTRNLLIYYFFCKLPNQEC